MTSTSQSSINRHQLSVAGAKDSTSKLSAISSMALRSQSKICRRSPKEFCFKKKQNTSERLTKSIRTDQTPADDVELGNTKLSSRYYHEPIHYRLFNYLKNFFESSATQHGKKNYFSNFLFCNINLLFIIYILHFLTK